MAATRLGVNWSFNTHGWCLAKLREEEREAKEGARGLKKARSNGRMLTGELRIPAAQSRDGRREQVRKGQRGR